MNNDYNQANKVKKGFLCIRWTQPTSKGIIHGDNPLDYTLPVLMVQLVIIFSLTRLIAFFIQPFRQSMIVAPIVAGMILEVILREDRAASIFFPQINRTIIRVLADFGYSIHLFILGVQVDTKLLFKSTRKKATVIGLSGTVLSFGISAVARRLLLLKRAALDMDEMFVDLQSMVTYNAVTFFASTNSLLSELKILNSQLGRLASSTSMISEITGRVFILVVIKIIHVVMFSSWKPVGAILSLFTLLLVLYYILRPLVLYMIKDCPKEKPMSEAHIFIILIFVLVAGMGSALLGLHVGDGAFFLGLFLPAGPPLGSYLVQRIDIFGSNLLLPVYFTVSGLRMHLTSMPKAQKLLIAEFIIILGYVGKTLGTILSALFFRIPLSDAALLALIMCYKGVSELGLLNLLADQRVVHATVYTLSVVTNVVFAAIAVPLVSYYYDPLRRYMSYQRRNVMFSKNEMDLKLLVCINSEANVSPVINLVEISNPTRANPITLYVLQLIELKGRASAVLVPHHKRHEFTSYEMTRTEPIVNAFKNFEQYNQGNVVLQHFTAVAPYVSMHNDICNLAMDKNINMLILPFHKQKVMDGEMEDTSAHIRNININVINKAPCSVGVFIDRSETGLSGGGGLIPAGQDSKYRIAMLFLGGADDQEALAYSRRMAEHPNTTLTVFWFKPWDHERHHTDERTLDIRLMGDFRANTVGNKMITYKEVIVEDGLGTTEAIRIVKNDFDLFIVGKHHRPDSPVTLGLDTEWGECPELGIIGDMLATSEYPFSVLVVQQQPLAAGFNPDTECFKDSAALINH